MVASALLAQKGPSTTCGFLPFSFIYLLISFVCRSSAQLVVARVAQASMVMPKQPLRAPPAHPVKALLQARLHQVDAARGTLMACRLATSSATDPAVRDSFMHTSCPSQLT